MTQALTLNADQTAVTTLTPRKKVLAATGGAGVATALAAIVIYVMAQAGITLPADIAEAVRTVLVATLTLAAAYFCPPGAAETVVRADDGSVKAGLIVIPTASSANVSTTMPEGSVRPSGVALG